MLTDSEKQQIIKSIMQAFDKWGERYYRNLFAQLNTPKGFDTVKIAFNEESFLERRAIDLGVYMDVLKRCNETTTISKHRIMLIKSAIISILKGSFTLYDLGSESKTSDESSNDPIQNKEYTRRQKQRLVHDYYPESIFEIEPKQIDTDDERFNHFSSVFSNNRLPESPVDMPVREYRTVQYDSAISNQTITDRLFFNSVLRFAFPQFLEDILKFRDECKTVFENLGENNDRIRFLREELTEFTPTLTTFYSHMTSILALRWFRFKSKKTQNAFFHTKFKLPYKKSDAENAKNLLVSATNSNDYSSFLLSHCANAFGYYKRPQDAILLFEQCRNLSNDVFENGIISQNIAIEYRSGNNFKLMLREAKKALSYYKKSGKTYHVCLALKLIGEAQYHLGFKESAISSFLDAEKLANELNQDKWKILLNIGVSFDHLGETHLRDKYLVRCLPLIPEDQTDTILGVNSMLGFR